MFTKSADEKRHVESRCQLHCFGQHQKLGVSSTLQILRFLEQHLREHTRKEGVSIAFAFIGHYPRLLCNDLMLLNALHPHVELARMDGRNTYKHVGNK